MTNNKISSLQFSILMFYPILALFSGIGFYDILKIANIDAYISIIIAFLLGSLMLGLFVFIFNYKPNLSLPDKIIDLFGNLIGNIMNWVINVFLIFIGIALVYSISNFIVSQFLAETPIFVVLILLGSVVIYNVSKGIEVIARGAVIFFVIVILLTLISTLGLIPIFDVSNIKPVMANGIGRPFLGGITFFLTNLVPIMVMLIFPKERLVKQNKLGKYIIIFYIIVMFIVFFAVILTIGALGIHLIKIYPHPEYLVLKNISIWGFIERIENMIYVKWLFNNFVSFSLIVYYISYSIKRVNCQKMFPVLVTVFICVISQFLFKDNTEFKWCVSHVYPYLNLALLGILIIIGMGILFKRNGSSKSSGELI